jgi:hypothetical protein
MPANEKGLAVSSEASKNARADLPGSAHAQPDPARAGAVMVLRMMHAEHRS